MITLGLDEALQETFHAADALQDLLQRTEAGDPSRPVFEGMLRHECENATAAGLMAGRRQ